MNVELQTGKGMAMQIALSSLFCFRSDYFLFSFGYVRIAVPGMRAAHTDSPELPE